MSVAKVKFAPFTTKNSIIRNLMSKISLYVWGWGCGWWVGGLYVHTLVKNLLNKFLMMLFLVAKGCKFDSCCVCVELSIILYSHAFTVRSTLFITLSDWKSSVYLLITETDICFNANIINNCWILFIFCVFFLGYLS